MADLAKAFHRPVRPRRQYSTFRRRLFGAPAEDRPAEQFVVFDQNHDQVGNRAFGDRLPAAARPLAAFCTLLSPFTPMLFMGEEYGEDAPFQFFTDHIDSEIAEATREGRRREFAAFASFGEEVPDPQAPATFARSKLTRRADPAVAELYPRLLGVRRTLCGRGARHSLRRGRALAAGRARRGRAGVQLRRRRRDACRATGPRSSLATPPTTRLGDGAVTLDPLAGALLR